MEDDFEYDEELESAIIIVAIISAGLLALVSVAVWCCGSWLFNLVRGWL